MPPSTYRPSSSATNTQWVIWLENILIKFDKKKCSSLNVQTYVVKYKFLKSVIRPYPLEKIPKINKHTIGTIETINKKKKEMKMKISSNE